MPVRPDLRDFLGPAATILLWNQCCRIRRLSLLSGTETAVHASTGHWGTVLLHAGIWSASAAVTALTLALVVKSVAVYAPAHLETGPQSKRLSLSIIDERYFDNQTYRDTLGLQAPTNVASLTVNETPEIFRASVSEEEPASEEPASIFAERFSAQEPSASFGQRFGGALRLASLNAVKTSLYLSQSSALASFELPRSTPPEAPITGPAGGGSSAAASAARAPRLPASASANNAARDSKVRLASLSSLPDNQNRTAIYDISAKVVYLPDGRKLEAHSGLGNYIDDPQYVGIKNQGPTPPNTYRLTLRESLFHGVRALRLTPIGDGNMFGRDGILAHHYLLGPNGDSNGCVSLANYPAFLAAFLKGDIDRLVVVERLDNPPSPTVVATGWVDRAFKNIAKVFGRDSGT